MILEMIFFSTIFVITPCSCTYRTPTQSASGLRSKDRPSADPDPGPTRKQSRRKATPSSRSRLE